MVSESPARPGSRPDDAVPMEVSRRRSRIGLLVPALGMPVLLGLSAILVATKATPPGIGIIAFFWGFAQLFVVTGSGRRKNTRTDRQHGLITSSSWTGPRTLNLTRLATVRRVKWTFTSEYGGSDRVDYMLLTDAEGVRLTMSARAAAEAVPWALNYQRGHNIAPARVSRFAAMGLGLARNDSGYRLLRFVVLLALIVAYVAVIGELIVTLIPALAPGH